MKDTGEHIANMLKTMKGEHCLFRSFGLNETDKVGRIQESAISVEVAKWFPNVTSVSITKEGESSYTIHAKEG